jgi:hypothetical protein
MVFSAKMIIKMFLYFCHGSIDMGHKGVAVTPYADPHEDVVVSPMNIIGKSPAIMAPR